MDEDQYEKSEEEEELAKCGKKQKDENVNRRLNRRLDGEEDEEKTNNNSIFLDFLSNNRSIRSIDCN